MQRLSFSMLRYAQIFGVVILVVTSQILATPDNEKSTPTAPATVAGPALCTEFVGVDFNHDCYVDMDDYRLFQLCVTGPDSGPPSAGCEAMDLDVDGDVDESDFTFFPQCVSGPEYLADATCEDPAYTPPTSLDRIDDELAAGLITELDALRYSVFDVFGDSRLPSRFYGSSYEEGTHALQSLSDQYGSLSPEAQAELLPFILPPDAPGSWYQNQLLHTTVALAGEPEGNFAQIDVKDGSGVSVAVIKYPVTQDYLDEATVVYNALNGANGVWEKLTTLMGRDPISDTGLDVIYNGADGRYDIYLMPLGGNTYGSCTAHSPGFFQGVFNDSTRSSFIIMDITNISTDFPGTRLAKKLRANLSHEFMHSIQFAFDSVDTFTNRIWLMDAVSTWAEHYAFPNDHMEQDDAPSYLKTLDVPMELDQGNRRYGVYLFFFHHAMKYGESIIRTIFENTESSDSLTAVNNAVPGGFADNWAEFAVENWNDTNNPPVDGYEAEDMLKVGAADYNSFELPILSGPQDVIELSLSGSGLQPLSAQYFRVKLGDVNIRTIMLANGLTFDLDQGVPTIFAGAMGDETLFARRLTNAQRDKLHLMVLIKQNGVWQPDAYDFTDVAFGTFCNEANSESVEEIVIIMANARFENDERSPVQPQGLSSRIFISNMGCGEWSGTARYESQIAEPDEATLSVADWQKLTFSRGTVSLDQIAAGAGQITFNPIPGGEIVPAGILMGFSPPGGNYFLKESMGTWSHSSNYQVGDINCQEGGTGNFVKTDDLGSMFTVAPYLTDTRGNELASLYRSFFVQTGFVDTDQNFMGQCVDGEGNITTHDSPFGAGIGGGYRNSEFGLLTVTPSGNRINETIVIDEVIIEIDLESKDIP